VSRWTCSVLYACVCVCKGERGRKKREIRFASAFECMCHVCASASHVSERGQVSASECDNAVESFSAPPSLAVNFPHLGTANSSAPFICVVLFDLPIAQHALFMSAASDEQLPLELAQLNLPTSAVSETLSNPDMESEVFGMHSNQEELQQALLPKEHIKEPSTARAIVFQWLSRHYQVREGCDWGLSVVIVLCRIFCR